MTILRFEDERVGRKKENGVRADSSDFLQKPAHSKLHPHS